MPTDLMPKSKNTRKKLYEGSSKILYHTDDETTLVQFFKDTIVLPDKTKIELAGKGVVNNSISAYLMEKLNLVGISTHFIEKVNMREQKIQIVEVLPIRVIVTNLAHGRYVSQFGIQEGYVFNYPMMDFQVKNSDNGNPLINEYQIKQFNWMNKYELKILRQQSIRVNDFLSGIFAKSGLRLVSCELEFGRVICDDDIMLMLSDEISPDTCRIWDISSNEKMDSESIKLGANKLGSKKDLKIYETVLKRLM